MSYQMLFSAASGQYVQIFALWKMFGFTTTTSITQYM